MMKNHKNTIRCSVRQVEIPPRWAYAVGLPCLFLSTGIAAGTPEADLQAKLREAVWNRQASESAWISARQKTVEAQYAFELETRVRRQGRASDSELAGSHLDLLQAHVQESQARATLDERGVQEQIARLRISGAPPSAASPSLSGLNCDLARIHLRQANALPPLLSQIVEINKHQRDELQRQAQEGNTDSAILPSTEELLHLDQQMLQSAEASVLESTKAFNEACPTSGSAEASGSELKAK
jgi:hypothetical protein